MCKSLSVEKAVMILKWPFDTLRFPMFFKNPLTFREKCLWHTGLDKLRRSCESTLFHIRYQNKTHVLATGVLSREIGCAWRSFFFAVSHSSCLVFGKIGPREAQLYCAYGRHSCGSLFGQLTVLWHRGRWVLWPGMCVSGCGLQWKWHAPRARHLLACKV